jgi:hypothetical protein
MFFIYKIPGISGAIGSLTSLKTRSWSGWSMCFLRRSRSLCLFLWTSNRRWPGRWLLPVLIFRFAVLELLCNFVSHNMAILPGYAWQDRGDMEWWHNYCWLRAACCDGYHYPTWLGRCPRSGRFPSTCLITGRCSPGSLTGKERNLKNPLFCTGVWSGYLKNMGGIFYFPFFPSEWER